MRQPDENIEDNPVHLCMLKKNRFGVLPKNDREFYRVVVDRLLSKAEWTAHTKSHYAREGLAGIRDETQITRNDMRCRWLLEQPTSSTRDLCAGMVCNRLFQFC